VHFQVCGTFFVGQPFSFATLQGKFADEMYAVHKHPKMRVSLKIKLIVLMVAILGATVFASYIIFERSGDELLQQVVEHMKSVENVGNIVEIQQLLTTNGDLTITHRLLVRLSQQGKISQISLLDVNHRVIASSLPEDVGLTLQELEQRRVLGSNRSFWEALLKNHFKKYDITLPILENGRQTGYINVVLVMNDLEYLIKKAKYSNIFWIVSIFAGGTIVAILLVHRFTRPIDLLVSASKSVAQGNFETTVHIHSNDEFDTLITGFNEMTQQLKEHKALEERYHRSERMAALGELGARLAHEIRNPLNSIQLIVDHLKDRFAPSAETDQQKFEHYITNIKTELKRLNKLVTDFLQVSRPLHLEMHPIRLKPFLMQIQQLLEAEAEKNHVQFKIDISSDELELQGDEGLLKTAFLNIALNAIQAMDHGGHLHIYAGFHQRFQEYERFCEITFTDTGPGVPREYQQKIFEPYFTTKKEGTGLGLAIVNRVIEDHHGTIHVTSEEGKGTMITVILPMAKGEI
jgi:signal transduction histidine kinase